MQQEDGNIIVIKHLIPLGLFPQLDENYLMQQRRTFQYRRFKGPQEIQW